jgi:hypothetical protein
LAFKKARECGCGYLPFPGRWDTSQEIGKSKIAREGEINISSLRDLLRVLGVCAINRVPVRGYLYNSNCYFFFPVPDAVDFWQLCNDPVQYRFSSAKFYEMEEDEFKILTHYRDKL